MPGGKSSPALFELIRDKTGTRAGAPVQAPIPVSRPMPSAPVREERVLEPRVAPLPPFERRDEGSRSARIDFQKPVTVTMFSVWLAVAGVLFAAVVLWVAAYLVGFKKGERTAMKDWDLSKAGGGIQEPLRDPPIPVNPRLITTPGDSGAKPAPAPGPGAGEALAKNQGGAGGGKPTTGADPRIAGLNYLTIALKQDRETAERMVAFLSENQVLAFAVPVAPAGAAANNPPTYTVYAMQGVTREELRARAPVRTELEDRVGKLGKKWKKDMKGQTDFSQVFWDKHGT